MQEGSEGRIGAGDSLSCRPNLVASLTSINDIYILYINQNEALLERTHDGKDAIGGR
jgi:hypothetical protein